uniref:MIF4G domain-containing protein n=1 Tax=Macrostomum lignano TaxID=282301 RepID=A0A1I8GB42_9PLAT
MAFYFSFEYLLPLIIKILDFFIKNQDPLSIDGLFGLCAIEGALEHLLATEPTLPDQMRQVLLQLQLVSRRTVNQSLPRVQQSDEVYFANMGFLLSSSWRPKVQYELLTAEHNTGNWNSEGAVDEAKLKEEFTESRSDQCLLDVHRNKDRCRFDSSCLRLMLHRDGARATTSRTRYSMRLLLKPPAALRLHSACVAVWPSCAAAPCWSTGSSCWTSWRHGEPVDLPVAEV